MSSPGRTAARRRGPTGAGTIRLAQVATPVVQRIEHTLVRRVAAAEVVAGDDDQPDVGGVSEAFGESVLGRTSSWRNATGAPAQSPSVGGLSGAGGVDEVVGMGDVWRDGEDVGVPLAHDRQVHERAVGEVDVGEQPVVAVARLDVAFEVHRCRGATGRR